MCVLPCTPGMGLVLGWLHWGFMLCPYSGSRRSCSYPAPSGLGTAPGACNVLLEQSP